MIETVNVHEAKAHLSRLLARVMRGEETVIARGGKPVARLVPLASGTAQRVPGSAAGIARVSDDFDAPLPASLLVEALW